MSTAPQDAPRARLHPQFATISTPEDGRLQIAHVDVGSGGGPPLVLLAGLTASYDYWKGNIAELARHRRVLAMDLPGFGRSSKPDASYSMSFFLRVLRAMLIHKGIERPILIGNSMGGALALRYALAYPSEVPALVLVAPAAVSSYLPHRLLHRIMRLVAASGGGPAAGGLAAAPRLRPQLVRLLFRAIFPTRPDLRDKSVRIWLQTMSRPDYPLYFRATLRSLAGMLRGHIGERARQIRAPTLIVWGARDRLLPVWSARPLAGWIQGSELLIYPESGHCPMLDEPARFNADVERFLARVGF
jgi:pimeloyl-ACP methyl ester carboxylesterase